MALDAFSQAFADHYPSLPPTLRRIADYMDRNRLDVVASSAIELGRRLDTSDASVVRAAKGLGFEGLPDLKRALAQSLANGPVENFRKTLASASSDARVAAQKTLQSYHGQLEALLAQGAEAQQAAVATIARSQRVALFGIGPTSHIAAYGAAMLQRHGVPSLLLDRTGRGLADQLLALASGDVLLLFSYGEPYREVVAARAVATELALPTILVTDRPRSRLARSVDVVAHVPRGQASGMSLHAMTIAWLESVLVGASIAQSKSTTSSLQRLELLRDLIADPTARS